MSSVNQVGAGALLAEGKTKMIFEAAGSDGRRVIVESKDDITAGDGMRHDIVAGKGELSNRTTSNVFRFLTKCGLPVAFIEELDGRRFLAERCEMIPYEVVVRREAHGSYLERNPSVTKGCVFPELVVEFFLKTSGRQWAGTDIPTDDPFVYFENDNVASLYLPHRQLEGQEPFLVLEDFPLRDFSYTIQEIRRVARRVFLALEKAWQLTGRKLVDLKVEFGTDADRKLLVADVIDNDSWRVLDDGKYIDKQTYRDDGDINTVTVNYRLVERLTGCFGVPRQQVVFCDTQAIFASGFLGEALAVFDLLGGSRVGISVATACGRLRDTLEDLIGNIPDTVVIAQVGDKSIDLDIPAQLGVPVIAVQALSAETCAFTKRSYHGPCVVSPSVEGAIRAAFKILSSHNPKLYMVLRFGGQ